MTSEPADTPVKKRVYLPAVTPGLKKLLIVIAVGLSILGANSVYLAAITFLGYWKGTSYENHFYMWMFLLHLVIGIVLTVPFAVFSFVHTKNTLHRKNRRAVKAGWNLLAYSSICFITGYLLTFRVWPSTSAMGRIGYWLHVLTPVASVAYYISHRLYGPRIKWKYGIAYTVSLVVFVAGMAGMHSQDPRLWNVRGGGEKYFQPSMARTATGGVIPTEALMTDEYCRKCHEDAYRDHQHSMHRISSFNNPPYLFSVRETRRISKERHGSVHASRWCAGCHDPVPFLSGAFEDPLFDDPNFDPKAHPTATAGITCAVCHAITNINSTIGNGDYTIEEPLQYPFTYSENPILQWVNNQLVKAKPAFHKQTYLKPLHKTADFCSVCHKVSLPKEVTDYKEWLRGQNHYDSFFLSGVGGNFAGAFYYPPKASEKCSECHMPKLESKDSGNVDGKISDHRFPGANTGIPAILGDQEQVELQTKFLQDKKVRVDLFAVKTGGEITGQLSAPLRPNVPVLEPGKRYLFEVVVRTLAVGHLFTQGTVDSNEVWLEITAKAGDKVIGRSGHLNERREVDPWAHFINAYVLDRHGNRIDRRNAHDIFVPLYDHQIPPGAAAVVHYAMNIPADIQGPVTVDVKLNYRKFDMTYMRYVYGEGKEPVLPIVVMASDSVTFPTSGAPKADAAAPQTPTWMRWNDYGIGLLREGDKGSSKGELVQAEFVFKKVAELGQPVGWVNFARVAYKEGRLEDARDALERAVKGGFDAPWTALWFGGLIDKENGFLEAACEKFEKVLGMAVPERNFDFSKDYLVLAELGRTYLLRAQTAQGDDKRALLRRAEQRFLDVLKWESENLDAHFNLKLCYDYLGEPEKAKKHSDLHIKYKPDDNARDFAATEARRRNPAANQAAEAIVIYDLGRELP